MEHLTNDVCNAIQSVRIHTYYMSLLNTVTLMFSIINNMDVFRNINALSASIDCDLRKSTIIAYNERYTFVRNIRTLTSNWMGDEWIGSCINLRELNVSHNYQIHTCKPIANTLVILHACGASCTLGDDGLKVCAKIKRLDASYNIRITTCEPFPNIKVIYAQGNSGIDDKGLSYCKKIRLLSACYNKNITTHLPYAKTLKMIYTGDQPMWYNVIVNSYYAKN